jgi:hypothetical protein
MDQGYQSYQGYQNNQGYQSNQNYQDYPSNQGYPSDQGYQSNQSNQGYQSTQGNQDNQDYLLQDIPVNKIEDLNPSVGEVQLLAMISNKEYFCYAIQVEGKDYLMFTDNNINLDFIKSNQNIIIMEDNLSQTIQLIYLDNGFIQKTINNITVSFVRYSGKLNPNNIIKYYDNYFSCVFNSVLKVYENHLNELVRDLKYFQMNNVNKPITATEPTLPPAAIPAPNINSEEAMRERRRKRIIIVFIVIFIIIVTLIPGGEITIGTDDY